MAQKRMRVSTWQLKRGFNACEQAVLTHGGMGYAKEYHVERLMRESNDTSNSTSE